MSWVCIWLNCCSVGWDESRVLRIGWSSVNVRTPWLSAMVGS